MRQFTQRELLSEGFWDGFKSVAKRAGNVGKFVGKKALPKTAAAIENVVDYGKGLKNAASSVQQLASKQLKGMGYSMMDKTWKPHGSNFVVLAKPMSEYEEVPETDPATGQPVIDPATGQPATTIEIGEGKPVPFIVDKEGKVKPISGRGNSQARKNSSPAATTATPSLSGGATATPSLSGGTPPPIPSATPPPVPTGTPSAAPTGTPSPSPSPSPTPPRRTGRRTGGPPGGARRSP